MGQMEFEEFADEQNAKASYENMLRALGVVSDCGDKAVDNPKIIKKINKIIEGVRERYDENTSGLKDFLTTTEEVLLEILGKDAQKALSMIDGITPGVTEEEEIIKLLKTHDINLYDSKAREKKRVDEYITEVLTEAIKYFDELIATNGTSPVHKSLRQVNTDEGIFTIFRTAAGKGRKLLVAQACALLRIATVIDFMNRTEKFRIMTEFAEKLEEICKERFDDKRVRGKIYFRTGCDGEIPMEIKEVNVRGKTRESITTKLLHKPEYREDKVLDHVGIRVTTKTPGDSLRFIYYTFFSKIDPLFPMSSIRVNRTKQLLVDEDKLLEIFNDPELSRKFFDQLAKDTINHAELENLGGMASLGETGATNEFSSAKYRAIHITFDLRLTLDGKKRTFPIEMQVLDEKSKEINEYGEAAHDDYVGRRNVAMKKRVYEERNLLTEFEKIKEEQKCKAKRKGIIKTKRARSPKSAQKTRRKK